MSKEIYSITAGLVGILITVGGILSDNNLMIFTGILIISLPILVFK